MHAWWELLRRYFIVRPSIVYRWFIGSLDRFNRNIWEVDLIIIHNELNALSELEQHLLFDFFLLEDDECVNNDGEYKVHDKEGPEHYDYQAIGGTYQGSRHIHHVVYVGAPVVRTHYLVDDENRGANVVPGCNPVVDLSIIDYILVL